jgi:GLPGLI family protein
VYERKTNLYKSFKSNDNIKNWIKEADKIKVEMFELYFNDTLSVFQPQETDVADNMSWLTTKNTVYQDFKNNSRLTIKDVWGEKVYLQDSLYKRKWKITDSKRNISGYNCRKAIWKFDDSTRIYAWYTDALMLSTGPESFNGLPGVILGLATEDGGIIYFAKSVELINPELKTLEPRKGKNKIYTTEELRIKLEKQYGSQSWYKDAIKQIFGVW